MPERKITIGQAIDQILEALEGLDPASQRTVLNTITTHLGIAPVASSQTTPAIYKAEPRADNTRDDIKVNVAPSETIAKRIDIRTLKEQKKPESANQMACLVGYYLQELAAEEERSETFSSADLEKYFKQAGYPLPNDLGQVLRDSKRAGYLEAPSRGLYKLNAVGYNLVAHKLPRGGAD